MSQSNTGQAQAAETLTQETRTFIRQVRTKTRRKYAPEDKIRIVLEGFRREVSVSGLGRSRHGINGRGGANRTPDLLLPKQAPYRWATPRYN